MPNNFNNSPELSSSASQQTKEVWLNNRVTQEYLKELVDSRDNLNISLCMAAIDPTISSDSLRLKLIELSLLSQLIEKLKHYAD